MNLTLTALRAIKVYVGSDLWISHRFIEADTSAKGLAFTIKPRPFFGLAKKNGNRFSGNSNYPQRDSSVVNSTVVLRFAPLLQVAKLYTD